jgi:uncharacterized protein (DUF983 family)
MKALKEVAVAVLVSALFIGLATVWPVWASLVVVIPFMVLLVLAQVGERREERRA